MKTSSFEPKRVWAIVYRNDGQLDMAGHSFPATASERVDFYGTDVNLRWGFFGTRAKAREALKNLGIRYGRPERLRVASIYLFLSYK